MIIQYQQKAQLDKGLRNLLIQLQFLNFFQVFQINRQDFVMMIAFYTRYYVRIFLLSESIPFFEHIHLYNIQVHIIHQLVYEFLALLNLSSANLFMFLLLNMRHMINPYKLLFFYQYPQKFFLRLSQDCNCEKYIPIFFLIQLKVVMKFSSYCHTLHQKLEQYNFP